MLGSANVDLVLAVGALPAPGQTLLATGRDGGPGGKGLNQAVASARAGARTRFVGAVGADPDGATLRQVLADAGIEALVRTTGASTGLAVVMVDPDGENAIVVAAGANADLVALRPDEAAAIGAAEVLLMQLEVPLPTVAEAARAARDAGVRVVLNAAPEAALDPVLTDCVDLLVVNEGEAAALAGDVTRAVTGADDVLAQVEAYLGALLDRVPAVVVTLGPRGALYGDRSGARHHEPGRQVPVTDTTGAGDTFAGYLAAALADGVALPAALARATTAAGLCVQRAGAVPAVPFRDEVDAVLTG